MNSERKKKILRRLRILEGQVRGVQRMVEEDKYCVDILCQTSAIREAISSIEDALLENHLSTHVIEQIKSGKTEQPIREVLQIYKLAKKR